MMLARPSTENKMGGRSPAVSSRSSDQTALKMGQALSGSRAALASWISGVPTGNCWTSSGWGWTVRRSERMEALALRRAWRRRRP